MVIITCSGPQLALASYLMLNACNLQNSSRTAGPVSVGMLSPHVACSPGTLVLNNHQLMSMRLSNKKKIESDIRRRNSLFVISSEN